MKRHTVSTITELDRLEALVAASTVATLKRVYEQLQDSTDLTALARLEFEQVGCDPLDAGRPLNFVEQLNQSFTYLATIEGARRLLQLHPANVPLHLNLGTAPGSDIVSADGEVAAETFAATHPNSNNKLQKDIAKVRATHATHRYVFYLSPAGTSSAGDVTVVRLDPACMSGSRVADV